MTQCAIEFYTTLAPRAVGRSISAPTIILRGLLEFRPVSEFRCHLTTESSRDECIVRDGNKFSSASQVGQIHRRVTLSSSCTLLC